MLNGTNVYFIVTFCMLIASIGAGDKPAAWEIYSDLDHSWHIYVFIEFVVSVQINI